MVFPLPNLELYTIDSGGALLFHDTYFVTQASIRQTAVAVGGNTDYPKTNVLSHSELFLGMYMALATAGTRYQPRDHYPDGATTTGITISNLLTTDPLIGRLTSYPQPGSLPAQAPGNILQDGQDGDDGTLYLHRLL